MVACIPTSTHDSAAKATREGTSVPTPVKRMSARFFLRLLTMMMIVRPVSSLYTKI